MDNGILAPNGNPLYNPATGNPWYVRDALTCCCCCTKCGNCYYGPCATATITWSFTIDPGALDLNGSGRTWADDYSGGIALNYDADHAGSVTAPVFLADITGGGTTGDTRFSFTDASNMAATAIYSCADNQWGFVVAGPGNGIFLSHDNDPLHSTNHLGLITGSCSGCTVTNAIFSTGPGGDEFLATGSGTVVISNNPCTGVSPPTEMMLKKMAAGLTAAGKAQLAAPTGCSECFRKKGRA